MRVPINWLKQYVDIEIPAKELADKLTFSGTEVEGIEQIGSAYEHFVVGEVRSVEKHPNADKLSVCKVFDGTGEVQVVCGAPNVRAGGKYPFAKIGATIPNGGFAIKKAKLRGVESNGMLCAADELGQPGGHEGLFVLDAKWDAGTPLSQVFGPPETVLELEITPNRPDCLSMTGIAREVAAVTGKTLKWPETGSSKSQVAGSKSSETRVSGFGFQVSVEDSTACPRYTARLLKNIKIGPSPGWMQRRLELAGIRAINNIVDVTNYVMLECGHPLHAFDFELIHGEKIIVRRAKPGERMATLDGIERELNTSMLVIADEGRAIAVAGVMGGAGSEIRDNTSTVLLESATFNASSVRATARTLGLSTESSYRFERGVDAATVEWASRRAAQLMCELAGATCDEALIDVYPQPVAPRKVKFRCDYIRERTGVCASDEEISAVFESLELPVSAVSDASPARHWKEAAVPTFRGDLQDEVDLVEEFARIHGLEKVPAPHPRAIVDPGDDRRSREVTGLRNQLVGLGLRETCNYSLVSEPLLKLFGQMSEGCIVLPNPISADQSVLRPSLIPQMVETLGRNRAHQVEMAGLFEIGRVFSQSGEEDRLCAGLMGPVGRNALERRRDVGAGEMFTWAKGLFESVAEARKLRGVSLSQSSLPQFEPGLGVEIRAGGTSIGCFGVIRTGIRKEWRLSDPVAALELSVTPLVADSGRAPVYKDIPAFPSIQRDVAMIVDEHVRHEEIITVMRKAAPPELENIELFDIFAGDAIGGGRKSMAFALTFRSASRTLTDDDANGYHATVKEAIKRAIGNVELRES